MARMIYFLLIFTTILYAAQFYIGKRVISTSDIPARYKRMAWIILLLMPVFMPVSFVLRFSNYNNSFVDILGWIAFINMGFFSLVIAAVFIRDIYLLILKIISKAGNPRPFDASKRAFLGNSANYTIIGASALLTGYGFYEARRKPDLCEVSVYLPNLPSAFEGYRIAQFTDLHVGPTIKRNFTESVVRQINNLKPDMIVFTGDLVDGSVAGLKNDVAPLRELNAPDDVFFVTGNHEYYSGAFSWIEEVTRLGMHVLLDEHTIIKRQNSRIVLAGVTDFTAASMVPEHTSDPFKSIKNAPENKVKILLAHQPKNIYKASEAGFDLQISGHTHGGQYVPWRYMVTLSQPYVVGLNKHKDTWIYINKGTGYWGPPLRLGVPSEVTLITLTAKKANKV
jgi:predicted MPP superfamily phosphohydrolase